MHKHACAALVAAVVLSVSVALMLLLLHDMRASKKSEKLETFDTVTDYCVAVASVPDALKPYYRAMCAASMAPCRVSGRIVGADLMTQYVSDEVENSVEQNACVGDAQDGGKCAGYAHAASGVTSTAMEGGKTCKVTFPHGITDASLDAYSNVLLTKMCGTQGLQQVINKIASYAQGGQPSVVSIDSGTTGDASECVPVFISTTPDNKHKLILYMTAVVQPGQTLVDAATRAWKTKPSQGMQHPWTTQELVTRAEYKSFFIEQEWQPTLIPDNRVVGMSVAVTYDRTKFRFEMLPRVPDLPTLFENVLKALERFTDVTPATLPALIEVNVHVDPSLARATLPAGVAVGPDPNVTDRIQLFSSAFDVANSRRYLSGRFDANASSTRQAVDLPPDMPRTSFYGKQVVAVGSVHVPPKTTLHATYYTDATNSATRSLYGGNVGTGVTFLFRGQHAALADRVHALAATVDAKPVVPTPVPSLPVVVSNNPGMVATFFQHCSYTGWSVQLGAGDYRLSALRARGFVNDDMSSVRVPAGLAVTLYEHDNFEGHSMTLYADNDCLVRNGRPGGNWNDVVSSVRVRNLLTPQLTTSRLLTATSMRNLPFNNSQGLLRDLGVTTIKTMSWTFVINISSVANNWRNLIYVKPRVAAQESANGTNWYQYRQPAAWITVGRTSMHIMNNTSRHVQEGPDTRALPLNQDVFVAVVWRGTSRDVYINGIKDQTYRFQGTLTEPPHDALVWVADASPFYNPGTGFRIRDMRIHNTSLTDAQVAAMAREYSLSNPPHVAPLSFPTFSFLVTEFGSGSTVGKSGTRAVANGSAIRFRATTHSWYTGPIRGYRGYFLLQDVSTGLFLRHSGFQCWLHKLGAPIHDFVWRPERQGDGTYVIRNPHGNYRYFLGKSGNDFRIITSAHKFTFRF